MSAITPENPNVCPTPVNWLNGIFVHSHTGKDDHSCSVWIPEAFERLHGVRSATRSDLHHMQEAQIHLKAPLPGIPTGKWFILCKKVLTKFDRVITKSLATHTWAGRGVCMLYNGRLQCCIVPVLKLVYFWHPWNSKSVLVGEIS